MNQDFLINSVKATHLPKMLQFSLKPPVTPPPPQKFLAFLPPPFFQRQDHDLSTLSVPAQKRFSKSHRSNQIAQGRSLSNLRLRGCDRGAAPNQSAVDQ